MVKEVKRTFCRGLDDGGCGLLVTVEDGKAVKIEGDPDSPWSKGFICPKGKALLDIVYHPDRLTYPLIRVGERGSGQWRRATWDEALDLAARMLTQSKKNYGAKSIQLASGSPKGLEVYFMHRLASLLGTPNVCTPANICHLPRELGQAFTFGGPSYFDMDKMPNSLIAWGINPWVTNAGGIGARFWSRRVLESGAKTIVIDPRKTEFASRASLWVRVRPGTDTALALGILKVVIEESLYDADFVAKWTVGWDEFKEYLDKIELQHISDVTWVSEQDIRKVARTYAGNRPGVILLGNAVDHSPDSFQTARAVGILKAITGNVDTPGGEIIYGVPSLKRATDVCLTVLRGETQNEMLGAEFQIARKHLFVPRQLVPEAILTGTYPVKSLLLFGCNPLLTYAESGRVYQALNKLDFLMVSDFFKTPTAELADLILPAATFLEFDEIGYYGMRYGSSVCRPQVIEPVGECRADTGIINELGKRLGFRQYFWQDIPQALDEILKPAGLSFEKFKEVRVLNTGKSYQKYQDSGFRTPSKKVELYSQQLKDMGYAPLPTYTEPAVSAEYPLVLTNAKSQYYLHSSFRMIKSLRKLHPEPRVEINPKTAAALGVGDGDLVFIETAKGRIRQRAKLNPDLDPRVVFADYGWWFPERNPQQLYGWQESNINMLTDSHSPSEPAVGSTYLRSIPCRLIKA